MLIILVPMPGQTLFGCPDVSGSRKCFLREDVVSSEMFSRSSRHVVGEYRLIPTTLYVEFPLPSPVKDTSSSVFSSSRGGATLVKVSHYLIDSSHCHTRPTGQVPMGEELQFVKQFGWK